MVINDSKDLRRGKSFSSRNILAERIAGIFMCKPADDTRLFPKNGRMFYNARRLIANHNALLPICIVNSYESILHISVVRANGATAAIVVTNPTESGCVISGYLELLYINRFQLHCLRREVLNKKALANNRQLRIK